MFDHFVNLALKGLKESFDAFVHYRIDQSTKKFANVGKSLQESLHFLREDIHSYNVKSSVNIL